MAATTNDVIPGGTVSSPGISLHNYLQPGKLIKVLPIEANGKWDGLVTNADKKKKDPLLFENSQRSFSLPFRSSGGLIPLLDNEVKHKTVQFPNVELTEQEFFEKILDKNLNVYADKANNFWFTFRVSLRREATLLNLGEPLDFLKYKVLLANKSKICLNYDDRLKRVTYQYVIVDEKKLVSRKIEENEYRIKAYQKMSEVIRSSRTMEDFIKVSGLALPKERNEEWLKSEIVRLFENDLNAFMRISEDVNYSKKVFIYDCIEAKLLKKEGTNRYLLDNGVETGSLEDTIAYIFNPENSDMKLRFQNRVEANKKINN